MTSSELENLVRIIDRNPQTFVRNIFDAKEADFRLATHRVHRSPLMLPAAPA